MEYQQGGWLAAYPTQKPKMITHQKYCKASKPIRLNKYPTTDIPIKTEGSVSSNAIFETKKESRKEISDLFLAWKNGVLRVTTPEIRLFISG